MTIKTRSHIHVFGSLLSLVSPLTVVTIVVIGSGLFVAFDETTAQTQQEQGIQEWHTGRDLDLFNQASISANWTTAKRRERLLNFAKKQKVAVFVDRRVDPAVLITFGKRNCTIEQFYWALAEHQKLGVCRLNDVFYFGPSETTHTLPVVWVELKKKTARLKKSKISWSAKAPIKTDVIASPASLLETLAKQNGFEITNPESIPHDIWEGFELPSMSLDQRVAILLVGFGKWFERSTDGTTITIVDLPNPAEGRLEFANVVNAKEVAAQLKPQFKSVRLRGKGKVITATGSPADLAAVRSKLVSLQVAEKADISDTPWTLKLTRAPRRAVLQKITSQTGLKLVIENVPDEKLDELIGFDLDNVTLDELFTATLEGSGLKFERTEGVLRVYK